MSALVLLTSADCHLCDHSKAVLGELGLDWSEVEEDSPEGARLAATAPPMRPVLFDGGRAVAYGRLSRKRLARQFR